MHVVSFVKFWSTQASLHLSTLQCACAVRTEIISPWTPAGPASSTLGAAKWPSSSGDIKSGRKLLRCLDIGSGVCFYSYHWCQFCSESVIISLIIPTLGRSPLNEDVFAAPSKDDITVSYEEVKDLQAKIYKLFLQVKPDTERTCLCFMSIWNIYPIFSILSPDRLFVNISSLRVFPSSKVIDTCFWNLNHICVHESLFFCAFTVSVSLPAGP